MLAAMPVQQAREGYELWRPNREKAEAKTMKAVVAFVLLVSAGLLIVITIGGWEHLLGPSVGAMSLLWAGLYILFAFLVARWNRGILPMAAALSIILLVFSAIAAQGWFDRDSRGFDNPGIPPGLLGLLTLILIPVLFLLIVFAMRGFAQKWNVEVEMSREEYDRRGREGTRDQGGAPPYQPQAQGR